MEEPSRKVTDKNVIIVQNDPLTGAFSRAHLLERLTSSMEQARFSGESLSLCMIDLDYFKSINDAFGHLLGDQVLQQFVHCVQGISRQTDLLFRYGGDEFILLLPHTTKAEAVSFANRIIKTVQTLTMKDEVSLNLSVSIGIATFPEDAGLPEPLIEAADYSCYEAKRRGRGQAFAVTSELNPETGQLGKLSRLIERDSALVQFQSYLHRLSKIGRGVFSILGTSGSGRTFLLNYLSTLAQMNDFCVINLRAFMAHKFETFGVLRASNQPDLFMNSGEQLTRALLAQMNSESAKGIIITLDDLPDSDHASIHRLRQCLLSDSSLVLGLVYTAEPESARPLDETGQVHHDTAYLHPFSPEGARAFIRSTLNWEPESAFMDWLYKETRGLPRKLMTSLNLLIEGKFLLPAGDGGWTVHPSYQAILLSEYAVSPAHYYAKNLPRPLTDFFGRDREIRQINSLLDQNRLVTLCGPGGIGKTRLSIHIGWNRMPDFSDGVFFVPLASVSQIEELPLAVAKIFGVQETPGQTLPASIKENLRGKHCLLILDNFEQIVAAAPLITDLLADAPLLTVMVTSREVLHIHGEKVFHVPPLESPLRIESVVSERIAEHPAMALFASRAQSVQANFCVNDNNAAAVMELCANLEGIPLAIELAAAQISILSPAEMIQKSHSRLAWLNNGPRDVPERQRTLRGVIDWSYNLLTPEEQLLFAHLGVFSGGFTLDAVEFVVSDELTETSVAEVLQSLTQKSLLRRTFPSGSEDTGGFEMLETIREYALECLERSGECASSRRRHAEFYHYLAEEAVLHYYGPLQTVWLNRLVRDHANFSEALSWARKTRQQKFEIDLTLNLCPFWDARCCWSEGHLRLRDLIERVCQEEVDPDRIRLYLWYGWFSNQLGECIKAEQWLEKGLSLCRKTGDLSTQAWFLYRLGWAIHIQGDFLKGVQHWEASLTLFRALDNKAGIAIVLNDLGRNAFYNGNQRQCELYCCESLSISNELGYKKGIAQALRWLGEVARADGQYEQAMDFFGRSFKCSEALTDKFEMANALFSMAELSRSLRDYDQAANLYQRHYGLCRELGYKPGVAYSLPDLGEIYRYQGKFKEALEHNQAGLVLLEEIGDMSRMTWVYRNMAEIAFVQNQVDIAKRHLQKSLGILREHSHFMLIPLAIQGLVQVALAEEQPERAARLLGTIHGRMQAIRAQISLDDWEGYERRIDAVKTRLDETDFNRLLAEGERMSLEETVIYALDEGLPALASSLTDPA